MFDSSRHRPRCFTPPAKDIFCVVMAVLASRPSSTRKPVHKPVRTSPLPRSGLSRSKSQFGRGGNTRAPRAPAVAHLFERHDGLHLALAPKQLDVFRPPAKCPCVGRRQGDDRRKKIIGGKRGDHPQKERQIVDRGPCTSAAGLRVGALRSPCHSRPVDGASGGGGASCASPR